MGREVAPPNAHVALVVLAWNRREDTLACLESVEALDWDELSVIVVDNASTDGVSDAVRDRFPSSR